MGWEDQGRQEHGWFGSGTGFKQSEEDAGGATLSGPKGLDPRIEAIARGAIAALPPESRKRAETLNSGVDLSRLKVAMTAWGNGAKLDQGRFAETFFGRAAGDPIVAKLREAAHGAAVAQSHADLRDAADALADAMQRVGLDRWRPFLADAEKRAQASATVPAVVSGADSPGATVVLPDGSRIPDADSPTGYVMSPVPDLSLVAAAGRRTGATYRAMSADPENAVTASAYLVASLGKNLGHGGTFDYQRQGNSITGFTQLPQFRNVSNVNVGVFAQQAGLTLDETLTAAGLFAQTRSSNADPKQPYGLDTRTAKFITAGFKIGQSGVLGFSSGPVTQAIECPPPHAPCENIAFMDHWLDGEFRCDGSVARRDRTFSNIRRV